MAHHGTPRWFAHQKKSAHQTPIFLPIDPPLKAHNKPPTILPTKSRYGSPQTAKRQQTDPSKTNPTDLCHRRPPKTSYSPSLCSRRTPWQAPPATRKTTQTTHGLRGGCEAPATTSLSNRASRTLPLRRPNASASRQLRRFPSSDSPRCRHLDPRDRTAAECIQFQETWPHLFRCYPEGAATLSAESVP